MRASWFVFAVLALSLLSGPAPADELLTGVTTDTWGVMSQGKMVYMDYHYATTTLFWAEVVQIDLATKTRTVLLPSGTSYPYYISHGFAGNHLAYILYEGTGGGSGGGGGGGSGGSMGGRSSYLEYKQLPSGTPRQLITDDSWKEMVWVGGDVVVWVDYRHLDTATADSMNSEIYLYNIATGTQTRLTSDHGYQEKPLTDGRRVVWIDYSAGYGKVFMHTIATGETREVAQNPAGKNNPRVSGNYVVWEDYRNAGSDTANADIYLYDASGNVVRPVCTAAKFQGNPYVDGNLVVWEDYRNAGSDPKNADIYAYNNISGIESAVVSMAGYQGHPTLNRDTLCWFTMNGSAMSLMMRDIRLLSAVSGGTRHAGEVSHPAIRVTSGRVIRIEGELRRNVVVCVTDINGRCVMRRDVAGGGPDVAMTVSAGGAYVVTFSAGNSQPVSRTIFVR